MVGVLGLSELLLESSAGKPRGHITQEWKGFNDRMAGSLGKGFECSRSNRQTLIIGVNINPVHGLEDHALERAYKVRPLAAAPLY